MSRWLCLNWQQTRYAVLRDTPDIYQNTLIENLVRMSAKDDVRIRRLKNAV